MNLTTEPEAVGRIDFRQHGAWIRGPAIHTSGELEAVLMASAELARAARMNSMRVVATPPGERPFVAQRWSPDRGWEVVQ